MACRSTVAHWSFSGATSPRARNLFLDLRGYGRSSKLPAGACDVTGLYVRDIGRIMAKAQAERVVLVGFASAGHLAFRCAAEHGGRLAGIVVINGSPCFTRRDDWPYGFDRATLDTFAEPLRRGDVEAALDRILDPAAVFQDASAEQASGLAAWFRTMGREAGADTLLGFFDDIAWDDARHVLGEIAVPTLLLAGLRGKEVPAGAALEMRRRTHLARRVEMSGSDHVVFATEPVLLNALIEDFTSGPSIAHRQGASPLQASRQQLSTTTGMAGP